MDTQNFLSNVMSANPQPVPAIGDGATVCGYTDRYAGTVTGIITKKASTIIVIREDHAERIDSNGMSEAQSYAYSKNPDGRLYHFRLRAGKSRWEQVTPSERGRWKLVGHGSVIIGRRCKFHDFSGERAQAWTPPRRSGSIT